MKKQHRLFYTYQHKSHPVGLEDGKVPGKIESLPELLQAGWLVSSINLFPCGDMTSQGSLIVLEKELES